MADKTTAKKRLFSIALLAGTVIALPVLLLTSCAGTEKTAAVAEDAQGVVQEAAAQTPPEAKADVPAPAAVVPAAVDIDAVLEKLPTQNSGKALEVSRELVSAGPLAVAKIADMLVEPGKGNDVKARLAIHGMAMYVNRPGAEKERQMYALAIVAELKKDRPAPIKCFLMQQLHIAGRDEAIPALGEALLDPELCETAAQALIAIPVPETTAALDAALAKAEGKSRRTIVQALGVERDAKAVPLILKEAASEDPETREVALFALGNIGDPTAKDVLLNAMKTETGYMQSKATEACMLLMRRMIEDGKKAEAAEMSRQILKDCAGDEMRHVRCAALRRLAEADGAAALGDIFAAMESEDLQIRTVAAAIAADVQDPQLAVKLTEKMKTAPPQTRCAILAVLGRRAEAGSLAAAVEAIKDPEKAVRIAALEAVGSIGGREAVKPLVGKLESKDGAEKSAAQAALDRVMGEGATAEIAACLAQASSEQRAILIKVLTNRGAAEYLDAIFKAAFDPDKNVQVAAVEAVGALAPAEALPKVIQLLVKADSGAVMRTAETAVVSTANRIIEEEKRADAAIAVLPEAGSEAGCSLIRVLCRLGGPKALEAVRLATGSQDAKIKEAAIRALCDWQDAGPMGDLMALIKKESEPTYKVLALRGYLRMLAMPNDRAASENLKLYADAMQVAEQDSERKAALGGIGNITDPEALKFLEPYLQIPALAEEAAMATLKVARGVSGYDRSAAAQAIEKAAAVCKSEVTKKKVEEIKGLIASFEDFITAWEAAGPYSATNQGFEALHDVSFPPEKDDPAVKWKLQPAATRAERPWAIQLNESLGAVDQTVGYLRTKVYSPVEQDVHMLTGSDDGLKVWVNGAEVLSINAPRGVAKDQDKSKAHLKQGWNTVLMKVTQGGGDWEACLRFRSSDGKALEGVYAKVGQ
ncbi:MAG TPA: HEAT repeat domain-containing protein [Candidatus Brocadiia bacterium]|nr:HEAT repeat domain-containing protein [Candidatus Brocadiia bacterium]